MNLVTALVPVSERYVAAGDASSCVSLRRFGPTSDGSFVKNAPLVPREFAPLPHHHHHHPISYSTHTTPVGKCSHHAVTALAALGSHVTAASGASVSVWDVVAPARVNHYSTLEHTNCVDYLAPGLVAAVGNACLLLLFDLRLRVPAFSAVVSTDNLYAVAAHEGSIFCGGADGKIYRVDLRNQRKEVWKLGNDAVLDVHVTPGAGLIAGPERRNGQNGERPNTEKLKAYQSSYSENSPVSNTKAYDVVALLESGTVCGVGDSIAFSSQITPTLTHKIRCDVAADGSAIVCGDETGVVHVFDVEDASCRKRTEVTVGDGLVAGVRWCEHGFYAASGSEVVMVEI